MRKSKASKKAGRSAATRVAEYRNWLAGNPELRGQFTDRQTVPSAKRTMAAFPPLEIPWRTAKERRARQPAPRKRSGIKRIRRPAYYFTTAAFSLTPRALLFYESESYAASAIVLGVQLFRHWPSSPDQPNDLSGQYERNEALLNGPNAVDPDRIYAHNGFSNGVHVNVHLPDLQAGDQVVFEFRCRVQNYMNKAYVMIRGNGVLSPWESVLTADMDHFDVTVPAASFQRHSSPDYSHFSFTVFNCILPDAEVPAGMSKGLGGHWFFQGINCSVRRPMFISPQPPLP
jgi:hypothetical protein